ncbi:hypothetical protein BHE74_00035692, partial [Ensete ventricosum]
GGSEGAVEKASSPPPTERADVTGKPLKKTKVLSRKHKPQVGEAHNKNVAKRALISRLLRIARSPVRQPKSIIVFLCLLGTGTLHFIFSEGIAAMSSSWSRALTQISPYTFASIGIAISIGVSVLGAAWWDDRNLCFLPCFSS